MNIKITIPLLFTLVLANTRLNAQNYLLNASSNGTTINTCTGNFYDSGGPSGNYTASQNFTITFCPDNSTGLHIVFNFSQFDIDDNILGADNLIVYDGPNTASPILGTYNNGFSLNGLTLTASNGNASGCLTFQFTSSALFNAAGWAATISCRYPCQTVNAALASSVPPLVNNDFINACPGDLIQFNGTGIYPQNNTNYTQSNATSIFYWEFGDGNTAIGQNVTHSYPNPGGYRVKLVVTDVNGCSSTNLIDKRVQIAEPPVFTGTSASQYTICYDDSTILTGVVTPIEWIESPPDPIMDTVFLPDGIGVCYEPTITYDIFPPGATLTNINQLVEVWAMLEHSYLGDLCISLICPNGQEVYLHNQNCVFLSSLSGDLGVPVTVGNGPGTPYTYSWPTSGATYGTLQNPGAGITGAMTRPAGSYTSEQSLNGLIGCPLNGDWTLKVCDTQTQDDGYCFGFGITFDSSLYANLWSFTPVITSTQWLPGTGLTSTSSTTAQVGPFAANQAGTYTYTFQAIDDFGCVNDTSITITVLGPNDPLCGCNMPMPNAGNDTTVCSFNFTFNATNPVGVGTWTGPAGVVFNNVNSPTATVTVPSPGTYTFYWTDNNTAPCIVTDSITVTFTAPPNVSAGADQTINCGQTATFTATTTNTGTFTYTWNPGNVSGASFTTGVAGTYIVTISGNGCVNYDTVVVTQNPSIQVSLGPDINFGCGATGTLNATVTNAAGNVTYLWSPGNQTTSSINVTNPGTYIVTVSDGTPCPDSDTILVTFDQFPTASFSTNNVCAGQSTSFSDLSVANTGVINSWNWNFGDNVGTSNLQSPNYTYTQDGTYSVTLIVGTSAGCSDTITQTITIHPIPQADFTADRLDGCMPLTVNFSDMSTISTGNIISWLWNFGDNQSSTLQNPQHTFANSGIYSVSLTVSSNNGCINSITKSNYIQVYPYPIANFDYSPKDAELTILNPTVSFYDLSVGATQWQWSFGDGDSSIVQNPIHSYEIEGEYEIILLVENHWGCIDSTKKVLKVLPEFTFYIPNAFTPNNDKHNQYFNGKGIGISEYELTIFDRWGERIFTSNSLMHGWDGTYKGVDAQQDVYVYTVKIKDVLNRNHSYTGHFSLIR